MEYLLQSLYSESYECYAPKLRKLLQTGDIDVFLAVLHPGSVASTKALLLIWLVLRISHPEHPALQGITEILQVRIPSDPFLAAWFGCTMS
jgi:hypothetical protein